MMQYKPVIRVKSGIYSPLVLVPLTIVSIISSGYALSLVYDFHIAYFSLIFVVFFAFHINRNGLHANDKICLLLILLFSVSVFASYISHGLNNSASYISQICVAILALEITVIFDKEKIINFYIIGCYYVSIIAIIFHILVNSFGLTLPTVTGFTRTYGNAYIYFYIVGRSMRNCGIFWEPSIFASFVSLANVFIICNREIRHRNLKILVFSLAIISANSSTGYVLLLFCLFLLFFKGSIKNKKSSFGIRELFSIVLLLLLVIIWIKRDEIIYTFFAGNYYILKLLSENVAQSTRYNALFDNFNIFINNPITGSGIELYQQSIANLSYTDTATSISMLAKYGFLGLSYTILVIKAGLTYGTNYIEKILVCLLLLIIINTIPHQSFIVTWVLLLSMANRNHESHPPLR